MSMQLQRCTFSNTQCIIPPYINWIIPISIYRDRDIFVKSIIYCVLSSLHTLIGLSYYQFTVPNVKIYGDRDIFVKSSSTVQLRCVVSQSLVPPTYIEWRHNDEHLPLATSALRYVKGFGIFFFYYFSQFCNRNYRIVTSSNMCY